MMKKIYEFLLWNNCSNNCSFCHQRSHERRIDDKILNPQQQIHSLTLCKDFLNSEFEKGNHILLCGGEVFDVVNPDVKACLKDLLNQVLLQMISNEIELLYLNTNLLYEDTEVLDWFLDKIEENKLFDRLHFTTSYDIVGRFCVRSERLFYRNLKRLTDRYKDIHIIVNTILTKEACKRICEDRFGADFILEYLRDQGKEINTLKDWTDYFRVQVNTIPYIKLNYENAPEAPTRDEVFSALLHLDTVIPGYLKQYAENIALTQEKLLYEYNKTDDKYLFCSSSMSDCGHSVNFKLSFADSDKCFPCEIKKLLKYNK